MKKNTHLVLIAMLAIFTLGANAQNVQYLRQAGYDGLNVFETKKTNDVEFIVKNINKFL